MSDRTNDEVPNEVEGVQPPERYPGGVDSIADEDKYGAIPDAPVIPDLPTRDNPAVDDSVSAELDEPDESQEEPSTDGASEPEKETQA